MKQRLGIAMALISQPELLLLDEPTNGLDAEAVVEVREMIMGLSRERGITVIISSHILSEIEKMAPVVGVIAAGRLLYQGSLDSLREEGHIDLRVSDPKLAAAMLGSDRIDYRWLPGRDGGVLRLPELPDQRIGTLITQLVGQGVAVYRVASERKTLEQAFLELIESPQSREPTPHQAQNAMDSDTARASAHASPRRPLPIRQAAGRAAFAAADGGAVFAATGRRPPRPRAKTGSPFTLARLELLKVRGSSFWWMLLGMMLLVSAWAGMAFMKRAGSPVPALRSAALADGEVYQLVWVPALTGFLSATATSAVQLMFSMMIDKQAIGLGLGVIAGVLGSGLGAMNRPALGWLFPAGLSSAASPFVRSVDAGGNATMLLAARPWMAVASAAMAFLGWTLVSMVVVKVKESRR